MKQYIKSIIAESITKLYPDLDIQFSVDYAPANVDADFASNVAMILAKKIEKKPMEVAEEIGNSIASLQNDKGFSVRAVLPGFLNFTLEFPFWQESLIKIYKVGKKYGTNQKNKAKKARVEYVSANPTGPIHIGNARGGPYGETICRVLEATGYEVLREYIHNDVGGQIEKLGNTIWYWYQGKNEGMEFPEDGYKGQYPEEIAKVAPSGLNLKKLTQFAIDYIFAENLEVIERLGIKFDLLVKESELQESGKVDKVIKELKKKELLKEKDGALWFAPNDDFLEDREAVVIKSDGKPTYFASDIAYHEEKFTSGYDLVVDILGSNHHGHMPKLQALVKVFNPDVDFKVLLYQYVRVKRGKEVVKMAKRAGNFVTAKEVLDEVGKDSMIFNLLSTAVNTHVDFDLEQSKDTSDKNPVYKVQYAHARITRILEKAKASELWEHVEDGLEDVWRLQDPLETKLIKELNKFPELVEELSQTYNVHQLPHYLVGLADSFHKFYEKLTVLSKNRNVGYPEGRARLILISATKSVLANGLKLMRITPMDRM